MQQRYFMSKRLLPFFGAMSLQEPSISYYDDLAKCLQLMLYTRASFSSLDGSDGRLVCAYFCWICIAMCKAHPARMAMPCAMDALPVRVASSRLFSIIDTILCM
eukprot:2275029-Amphidinium_carterae.1